MTISFPDAITLLYPLPNYATYSPKGLAFVKLLHRTARVLIPAFFVFGTIHAIYSAARYREITQSHRNTQKDLEERRDLAFNLIFYGAWLAGCTVAIYDLARLEKAIAQL